MFVPCFGRQVLRPAREISGFNLARAAGTLPCPRPAKQNIYGKTCFTFEDARIWKTNIYLRQNCCKVDAARRRCFSKNPAYEFFSLSVGVVKLMPDEGCLTSRSPLLEMSSAFPALAAPELCRQEFEFVIGTFCFNSGDVGARTC